MIVIADVSGTGIPAAMVMAVTRTIIRNLANVGKSPREIFEETNRLLIEDQPKHVFGTMFLGYYCVANGALTYAKAGHQPAYIVNKEGAVSCSGKATGTIVGMLDEVSYTDRRIVIEPEN